jgi:two-component sensor histidine kinase
VNIIADASFTETSLQMSVGIAKVSLSGIILSVDQRLAAMIGAPAVLFRGRRYASLIHTSHTASERCTGPSRRNSNLDVISNHAGLIRPSGETVPVIVLSTLIRASDGRPMHLNRYVIPEAELMQPARTGEMNGARLGHAARQILKAAEAGAQASIRTALSLEEFRTTYSRRLDTLMTMFEHIVEKRPSNQLSVREMLKIAIGPMQSEIGDRLCMAGPETELGAEQAIALGIALHELAAGSVTHGTLSRRDGQVSVVWSGGEKAEDRFLSLAWLETGAPMPDLLSQPRSGIASLKDALVRQTGGKVKLTFSKSGMACGMVIPLADI